MIYITQWRCDLPSGDLHVWLRYKDQYGKDATPFVVASSKALEAVGRRAGRLYDGDLCAAVAKELGVPASEVALLAPAEPKRP